MGTPNQYSRRLFLQRAVLVSVGAAGRAACAAASATEANSASSRSAKAVVAEPLVPAITLAIWSGAPVASAAQQATRAATRVPLPIT